LKGGVKINKIKSQHYVPRFYLKNFSKRNGNEFVINCFDKSDFNQFKVNINGIGCENYFYENDDNPSQVMEMSLSKYEAKFSTVYNKLVSTASLGGFKWKEKEVLAQFIVIQEIRTREMREHLRDMVKKVKIRLSTEPLSKKLETELQGINTEKGIRSIQLNMLDETLLNNSPLVDMLLSLKWMIYENYTKMTFWISDHPVNRFNPIDLSPYGNLGLLSRGIEIFFPLTPKLGIAFCDPIEYFHYPEKLGCIKDNVLFYNTLQVRSSARHIFSIDEDFTIAKQWLNENPDFRNLDRDRTVIK